MERKPWQLNEHLKRGNQMRKNMYQKLRCPIFNGLGILCVCLGFIGTVVPGLPTTIFLILACGCFSRGSDRFREWLWTHPRYGASIQAWHLHRVVPVHAKVFAGLTMAVSYTALVMLSKGMPIWLWCVGITLLGVLIYLLAKPSTVPVSSKLGL